MASKLKMPERFWSKMSGGGSPDACWTWTGSKCKKGYGRFGFRRESPKLAHRVAWELTNGAVPEGLLVLHACDNPSCVNPNHLFIGTQQDNVDDMVAKGRGHLGILQGISKLNDEQVLRIRLLRKSGMTYKSIAAQFPCNYKNVHLICQRKTWKHILEQTN